MVAKRAARASSAAVHAGRPDSVRQRGQGLGCRPNLMSSRGGRSGTVVEVQTVSTKTILYTQHHWQWLFPLHSTDRLCHMHHGVWLCCEVVLYCYVTAKNRRSSERVHVCMYVRVTLTLQRVSMLTLEGIITHLPFLVVPTAVETNEPTA